MPVEMEPFLTQTTQTLTLRTKTQLPVDDKSRSLVSIPQQKRRSDRTFFRQFLRFSLVGGLNTAVDLFILNSLLWFWPTHDTWLLLCFNTIAYTIGAINSFVWNKYWTFRRYEPITFKEVWRFALTTLFGIACNDSILWVVGNTLHPAMLSATLWANLSKLCAIGGTVLISYLGMRLWVFVHRSQEVQK
jgi:putative flippase GtrA